MDGLVKRKDTCGKLKEREGKGNEKKIEREWVGGSRSGSERMDEWVHD